MARDSHSRQRRKLLKGLAVGGTAFLAGCSGDDGEVTETTTDDGTGGGGETETSTEVNFVHISSFEPSAKSFQEVFNGMQEDHELTAQSTPAESSTTREYYINQFVSQSSSFDVGMMDVVWPAEFVDNDWAATVEDQDAYTDEMLSTPVEAATIDGDLYGMPMFTDANGLYYRTDLLEQAGYDSPPETYMELVNMAQEVKSTVDEDLNGYIWQGGANEGLTIMWLNWLWGMGGSVREGGDLVVNTDEGVDALQHAVDLIYEHEITPESIPSSGTDGNRQTFQQGDTIFMRNWPYAYSLFQDDTPVTDKFDVTTMPKAEGQADANNSCLGGWSLFINGFSENDEGAQAFANFAGSPEAQEMLAADHSRLPVRSELYEDSYWEDSDNDKPGFLDNFAEILRQTSARPATAQYSQFSEIVYTQCNNALTQQKSPQEALDDAQEEIDNQIN
jgi:multiple sugar transport system substrate-binding protein